MCLVLVKDGLLLSLAWPAFVLTRRPTRAYCILETFLPPLLDLVAEDCELVRLLLTSRLLASLQLFVLETCFALNRFDMSWSTLFVPVFGPIYYYLKKSIAMTGTWVSPDFPERSAPTVFREKLPFRLC